jgi:FkbM family methyltransferase
VIEFWRNYAAYALRRSAQWRFSVLRSYALATLADRRGNESSIPLLGGRLAVGPTTPSAYLIWEIVLQRTYPIHLPASKTPFVIDAGANVGVAMLYFKRLMPAAQIVCVEPDSTNAALLRRTIHLSGLEDVQVIEAALTSDGRDVGLAGNGVTARIVPRSESSEVAPGVTLASLARGRRIDVLKVDIEGAETEILPAATEVLSRTSQLLCEVHMPHERGGAELLEVLQPIRESGHRFRVGSWSSGAGRDTCLVHSWEDET